MTTLTTAGPLAILLMSCAGSAPPVTRVEAPPSASAPAPPPPAKAATSDEAWFPLVAGATWEYDATFGTKQTHERRVLRAATTPIGRVFYFADVETEKDDNPTVGSNAFGLGAYRSGPAGIETTEVYFRDELGKLSSPMQTLLRFPVEKGTTTTVMGGKKLETRVGGVEEVVVPAGTFSCLRLDQHELWLEEVYEGAVWLGRGVGMVKRRYVTGRVEVLTAWSTPAGGLASPSP